MIKLSPVQLLEFRLYKQRMRESELMHRVIELEEVLWAKTVGEKLGIDLLKSQIDIQTGEINEPENDPSKQSVKSSELPKP